MRQGFRVMVLGLVLILGTVLPARAGRVYQDFEPDNGGTAEGWGINGAEAGFSGEGDPVHGGQRSWRVYSPSPNLYGGTGIPAQFQTWDTDLEPERHDRLVFWVYALPDEASAYLDNNVEVRFFDQENYKAEGVAVWTTRAAQFGTWTELSVLFSQLPGDFNLHRIDKLQFVNYNPGIYFFDDIQVVAADRVYQSFEPGLYDPDFSGPEYERYGWAWFGTVDLVSEEGLVREGRQAWQLDTTALLGGTGIKSQEKKRTADGDQSIWNVDLMGAPAAANDRLTFWVYALPANGLDNNLGVQWFDHDYWVEDPDPALRRPFEQWTRQAAVYGEWTRFEIPFADLVPDDPAAPPLNLADLNKLQFQEYWTGRYLLDDIRAGRATPRIDPVLLSQGLARWPAIPGAGVYTLQISAGGPSGTWQTVYEGADPLVDIHRVAPVWLRARWQEAVNLVTNPVPYQSDWGAVAEYDPPPVLLSRAALDQGRLAWTDLPQADLYDVEQSATRHGPWVPLYTGPHTELPAQAGTFYRVRALRSDGGAVVETGPWSPALAWEPGGGFLRADGLVLRDGSGEVVRLRGVNLGNLFLIEPWMTGMSVGLPDSSNDDWTIRQTLADRFGPAGAAALMDIFEDQYIQEDDLNRIMQSGANLVRLPIYYRVIREIDEATGQWAAGTHFDFTKIDRIVQWCADRGIYVLLDLHGAPGAQSREAHSGRISAASPEEGFYHKLFDPENDAYRRRTRELWQALAAHYRGNTAVMGYDLLNEPLGVTDPLYYPDRQDGYAALAQFYDELYQAVRAQDPDHLIVLEGVPSDKDWETLPNPADFGWTNVMYQFHYYGFRFNTAGEIDGTLDIDQQREYLISGADPACADAPDDDKFCGKLAFSRQDAYGVPVLIGEFNGFDQREIWDLFLETFEAQGWSWAMWSYKHDPARESWGWLTRTQGWEAPPVVGTDSYELLTAKFARYATVGVYDPNVTLIRLLTAAQSSAQPVDQPSAAGRTGEEVRRQWSRVAFDQPFLDRPVLAAGIETFIGPNPAGLRFKDLDREGFQVRVEEERSQDREVWHRREVVGYLALPAGAIYNPAGQVIGEAGRVTVRQKTPGWQTLRLRQTYADPVVLMTITSAHGRQPAHVRLRQVQGDTFEYRIEEWDYLDQRHVSEDLDYIVLEAGVHRLADGRPIEAGKVTVDQNWRRVAYQGRFAAPPATISQCQTVVESQAVVTREQNVTADGFDLRLQEAEASDQQHAVETVGYIAAGL